MFAAVGMKWCFSNDVDDLACQQDRSDVLFVCLSSVSTVTRPLAFFGLLAPVGTILREFFMSVDAVFVSRRLGSSLGATRKKA
jgi:hypothetical protein